MALHGISLPPQLPALERIDSPSGGSPTPAGTGSFVEALGGVERLQTAADQGAQQVALGGGNLHETALALEKADISLRVATKVRNKLVEAYQDIMRMSV